VRDVVSLSPTCARTLSLSLCPLALC
jgi:hypothetical protein